MPRSIYQSRMQGDITLEAILTFAGDDISVCVTGGVPHIGSISVAVPRPSLRGDGSPSATVSTHNLVGHKDDEIGDLFAHEIARQTGHICVVTCGIHIDDLTPEGIQEIIALAKGLLDDVLAALQNSV